MEESSPKFREWNLPRSPPSVHGQQLTRRPVALPFSTPNTQRPHPLNAPLPSQWSHQLQTFPTTLATTSLKKSKVVASASSTRRTTNPLRDLPNDHDYNTACPLTPPLPWRLLWTTWASSLKIQMVLYLLLRTILACPPRMTLVRIRSRCANGKAVRRVISTTWTDWWSICTRIILEPDKRSTAANGVTATAKEYHMLAAMR